MTTSDRALVLGGGGLLGAHLVRRLLQAGWRVRVLVQPGSDSPVLDGLDIERTAGDLLGAGPELARAAAGCRAVFHCAAITDLWAPPAKVWAVNLEGTRRVADACLAAGVERLVFTGSASSFQFGSRERPGDERGGFPAAYRGIAYMESKHWATRLVRRYAADRGLDAVVVAPTFLLGELDWRPSSGELIRQFVQRRMRFVSPGGRNFACAGDVAGALVAAFHRGDRGRCYIAGGHNLTYRDFFTRVARIVGDVPEPLAELPAGAVRAAGLVGSLYGRLSGRRPPLDRRLARLAVCGTYYDASRAVEQLGMQRTPVDAAIDQSVRSLRTYGHIG